MPTNPTPLTALQAANDHLSQENLHLQERVDGLEELTERLSTQLAKYMGAFDVVASAVDLVKAQQWTPTSDGSGPDPESF